MRSVGRMFELVIGLILLLVGILGIVAGVLARLGRLPRNRLLRYGGPVVLTSDRAWRVGHRAAWISIVLGGLIPAVSAVIILLSPAGSRIIWISISAIAIGVSVLVSRVLADRAVERDQLAHPSSAGAERV